MNFLLLLVTLLIMLLTSCKEQSTEIIQLKDEAEVKNVLKYEENRNSTSDLNKTSLKTDSYSAIESIITDPESDMENFEINQTIETYNSYIIKKIEKKDATDLEIKKYHNLIFRNCTSMLTSCSYLSKFQFMSNSIDLLIAFSKTFGKENITKRYFYLNAAFSINNYIPHSSLMLTYLKDAYVYEEKIKGKHSKLSTHYLSLSRIIANRDVLQNRSEFITYIGNFPFFETVSGTFEKELLEIAISIQKNFIYKKDSTLSDLIQRQITKLKNRDELLNPSDTLFFKSTFDLKPMVFDEYYFIIASMYNDSLSRTELLTIWNNSKKDYKALSNRVKAYVRNKFLLSLKKSNFEMIRFFKQEKFSPKKYFEDVEKESKKGTNIWNKFNPAVSSLEEFIKGIFNDAENDKSEMVSELSRNLFTPLKTNIKYMAVYPQMLMMIHFFSKRGYVITYETFWGYKYVIESDQVFDKFFRGVYGPFFEYGNDLEKISSEEIVYSFNFALNGGLFRDYAGVKKENSFIKEIFKETIRQLTVREIDSIINLKNHLYGNFIDQKEVLQYTELCDNILNNKDLDYKYHLTLKDFMNRPYVGVKNPEKVFLRPIYSRSITKLDRIRLKINSRISKIETMISMYEIYLKRIGTEKIKIKKYLKDVRSLLKPLKHQVTSFHTILMNAHNKLDKCVFKVHEKDESLQKKLLAREDIYLRSLYRNFIYLKENSSSFDSLNNLYKNSWDNNFVSFDKFENDSFFYHQIDFLMRMRKFVSEDTIIFYPTSKSTLKALAPAIDVEIPHNQEDWAEDPYYSKASYDFKKIDLYINEIQNDQSVKQIFKTEDQFVNDCFKHVAGSLSSGKQFTRWTQINNSNSLSLTYYSLLIQMYTSIYKSDNLYVYDDINCALTDKIKNSSKCKTSSLSSNTDDFINLAKRIRNFIHITDDDIILLNKLDLEDKLSLDDTSFILKHPTTKTPSNWNTFDKMFYHIQSPYNEDYLSIPWLTTPSTAEEKINPRFLSSAERAQKYLDSRFSREVFLFKNSTSIEKILDKKFKNSVGFDLKRINDFINSVSKLDENDPILASPIRYSVYKTVERKIINKTLIDSYRKEEEEFHSNTNNFFRAEE